MFSSLKYSLRDYPFEKSEPAVSTDQFSEQQIYQYRKNFGVNLGSIFVLEKFIHGSFFVDDTGAELEAVKAQIKHNGVDQTRASLEDHWRNFVTDEDWKWLQTVGVTSVRIPVGFWAVGGGEFCENTPFESVRKVYANAWNIYKEYISKAKEHHISVLVDLHALPGGANAGDHSGMTIKEPQFWTSSKYQMIALEVLKYIVSDLADFTNVCGVQIVNESVYENPAPAQEKFYKSAIHKIRKISKSMPVVISDGWSPEQWVNWVTEGEKAAGGDLGVLIDVHIYRCFDEKDKNKDPDTIIRDLGATVLNGLDWKADCIVGEYSAVLDGSTWGKFGGDRNAKACEFVGQEVRLFNERAAGSYFWTFKFEHGDGGEWGFVPMVNNGGIPRKSRAIQNEFPSAELRDNLMNQKYNDHCNYWQQANSREKYDHERYKAGFLRGWNDAAEFAKFDGSTLGRKHSWMNARRDEHVREKGGSKYLWEWDQGFLAGVYEFEHAAGI